MTPICSMMDKAVERICQAIEEGENILSMETTMRMVTSASIVKESLEQLGVKKSGCLPNRLLMAMVPMPVSINTLSLRRDFL